MNVDPAVSRHEIGTAIRHYANQPTHPFLITFAFAFSFVEPSLEALLATAPTVDLVLLFPRLLIR